jgi:hypothetical protein
MHLILHLYSSYPDLCSVFQSYSTPNNRRSLRAGDFIVGGWVGDDPWEQRVPFQGLDFLDYGYLSCIKTGVNGPCDSPGQRSVNTKPDSALFNGAACVRFVIGGDKCNAADWNPEFYANNDWGCGVDVDNECEMTAEQISQQFNAVKNAGKSTMYTFLHDKTDLLKDLTVKPDHYAVMSFYGANWCRQSGVPAGCVMGPGDKSYEESVPQIIDNILNQIGAGNSKQLLLGLHANGIDEKTVDDWCRFIREKNLGGVMITFIHSMNEALFDRLKNCLAAPAPAPGKGNVCIAGDTRFHVTDLVGTTFEKQLDQLAVGEKIVGIDESKVKVNNCEVVSVFEMGNYEVFGNYTPDHYMLPSNAADKLVAHGQTGGARNFTTHQLLTTCPVAVDESGKISSTSICGSVMTKGSGPLPWKTYLDVHSALLTLIQATGITSITALKSRSSAQEHLLGLCTYGLLCSMTGMCDIYEEMMLNFVNAELTDDAKAKAYAAFPDLGDASSPKSCSFALYNKVSCD